MAAVAGIFLDSSKRAPVTILGWLSCHSTSNCTKSKQMSDDNDEAMQQNQLEWTLNTTTALVIKVLVLIPRCTGSEVH